MSRIFVVEDEAVVAEDIAQTLEQLGYEVAGTAQSGMAALLEVEKTRPDLVLMDIKLAGRLDGIQTTAAIRKRWAIPVIYLTSHSDEATLRRAKETAPHGYLLKPFNERDLRTAIEVSLRKHDLEQRLEQRERWFSTTLESVGDAVIATDPEERITFMNAIAESITGWKKDDAKGKQIHEVFKIASSDPSSAQELISKAIRGGFRAWLPVGATLVDRSGASVEVDDSIAPIIDSAGQRLGSVVIFRDITERRRLEERLATAERLASVATMAAGMAHEINNPLAAAVGNIEFASSRLEEITELAEHGADSASLAQGLREAKEALADAQAAGARVRRIVRDLKKFARLDHVTNEIVDLPDIIHSAIEVTHHLSESRIRVNTQLGTTPLVEAGEGQLVQVISNLLANAMQASAANAGREVWITTSTDELGRALIDVKDEGSGIRPENISRIFEPFFTTKPAGDGLGLGLSICQNLVTAFGGEIAVTSRFGHGATFRVTLPAAKEPEKRAALASIAPEAPRRARVLVIDDEEIVARVISRLLSKAHDVHSETDAHEALARLAQGEQYDVIFCDLTMPGLSGMEVHNAVMLANPELAKRIVFLTGGVQSERLSEFLQHCPNIIVSKPFSSAGLLTAIATLLPGQ